MDAIGIHIYGGGFTLGAMDHFNVLQQWEEIPFGSRTFDANFTGIKRPLKIEEWDVKGAKGIPFIFANPPCAPWSDANSKPGHTKDLRFFDKRLAYTKTVMETAMEVRPDVFICESVENAFNYGLSHYEPYIKGWLKRKYSVTVLLTDGIIHGLPSTRRRFHFIAHKYELKLKKPSLVNFKPTTVRETIWDLRDRLEEVDLHTTSKGCSAGIASPPKLWRKVPVGGILRTFEKSIGFRGPRGTNSSVFVRRIAWDAPATTVIGLSQFIHPDGHRLVTWRESLRFLSFPDWFTVKTDKEGSDTVTPLMGRFLSGVAKKTIQESRKVKDHKFDVVDWRTFGTQYHLRSIKKSNPDLV